MAIPHPYRVEDPFSLLGLPAEAEPAALVPAVLAATDRFPELATPRRLAFELLRHPWHAPVQGLSDAGQEAWLAYRQAVAAHRTCWDREEGEQPAEHDAWVRALEHLLKALNSPGMAETLLALVGPLASVPEAVDELGLRLDEARGDLLVEVFLEPAATRVEQAPERFELEAAHLQTIRTLGELGLRPEDHVRLLRRVLRSAGMLWLDVDRPDRASLLLEELSRLEPDSASVRHYLVRAKLLIQLAALRKGTAGFQLLPVVSSLEELADSSPFQWEVRTQLADLHLLHARQCIEERRATDTAEALVKAIISDAGWAGCSAMAGDVEGSMHEARLVGSLGSRDALRDSAASEQLKTTIRAGFSRGEMYLSRPRPWRLFESWPQAEAARLWHELGLPLDGGTFPAGCLPLVEAIAAAAPPLRHPQEPAWTDELRQLVREKAPELSEEQLEGSFGRWLFWVRSTHAALAAPIPARDLLFIHRLRERSLPAPPLGDGPYYRPVLGFGLTEVAEGLQVEGIRPGSAAEQAGLREKDLLVRVRGYGAPSTPRVLLALLGWEPGEPLELLVRREGQLHALSMLPTEHRTLDKLPQADLRRRFEKLLGLRADAQLKVQSVPRVGLLCQLKEGDVIQRVDGLPLSNLIELEQALRTVDMGQFLLFTVLRAGQPRLAKVVTLAFRES